jgi:hypothetical protein
MFSKLAKLNAKLGPEIGRLNEPLRLMYIGRVSLAKTSATMTDYVLAFATLGSTAWIGLFLFVSHHPMWPRKV